MNLLGTPVRGFTPFKQHKQGVQARVLLSHAQPLRPGVAVPAGARSLSRTGAAAPAAAAHAPAAATPAVAVDSGATSAAQRSGLVKDAPSFQEAIAKLQEYWASIGCAIWLPHNTEVSEPTRMFSR